MKSIYVLLFAGLLLGSCQVDLESVPPVADTATADHAASKDNQDEDSVTEGSTDAQDNSQTLSCETLFARGNDDQATCFLANGFSRWGWTNGPLEEGNYSFSLYAGAGQCDTEKGTLVGFVDIVYDGGMVTFDVKMLEGFVLSETHLYVGAEPYPADKNGNETVAPGQFPYKHDLDEATSDYFEVSGFSGPVYVIFHGVSCGANTNGGSGDGSDGGADDGANDGSDGGSTDGGSDGGNGDGTGTGGGGTGDYVPS